MPDDLKKPAGNTSRNDALVRDTGFESEDEKNLDLLMRFCSGEVGSTITAKEAEAAKRLITENPRWRGIFEEMKDDYQRMIDAVTLSGFPGVVASISPKGFFSRFRSKIQEFIPFPSVRIGLAAVVLLFALYGSAAVVSGLVTSPTVQLARMGSESVALRGEQAIPAEAVNALQSGRYAEAVDRLRALALTRMDSSTGATVDYYLGVAILHTAERSPLNLFPHYDRITVLDGIRHLQNALRVSRNDGTRSDFQFACQFALGKASLMLGDVKKAESYFLQVNERNNPYRMPARIILSSLSR